VLLTLIALILPLGLDTFGVAAALGIAGLKPNERTRVAVIFTLFEMGMPIAGLVIGRVVGGALSSIAEYIAAVALIALGGYILWPHEDDDEEEKLELLARTRGLAVLGLGLSISLDELAIGFAFGLLRLPPVLVIVLIGAQAFLVAQLGLRLGARVSETFRENAERLAGLVLLLLGIALLAARLSGRG
jgi:manganese efflux pump family protein